MPGVLRPYLAALYGALVVVLLYQAGPPSAWQVPWGLPLPLLARTALFAALTVVGESIILRGRDGVVQSLATVVHVAVILLFPPPAPLLITLAANVLSEARVRDKAAFKYLYNVAHTSLVVGACSMVAAHLNADPLALLRPGHALLGAGVLGVIVALYYLLDAGLLVVALSLLQRQPPWRVWWQQRFPTLLPELASGTMGILLALLWRDNPATCLLLLPPVVALRFAFAAIVQAEGRAVALRHVLAAGHDLRVQRDSAALLTPVAIAARAVVSADVVTVYLDQADTPGQLARVGLVPEDAPRHGPPALSTVAVAGRGIREVGDRRGRTLLVPIEIGIEGADGTGGAGGADGTGGVEAPVAGLLYIEGVPAALDADRRDALQILATQAAVALENSALHARALARASEDSLTGLRNHRAFQQRLEEELARAARGGSSVAVLMLDLDGFADINNTYGHPAGDAALQATARTLTREVRGADIVARYGGDEFAVILPDSGLEEATALAEQLCAAIAVALAGEGSGALRPTVSIGVACAPQHGRLREDLVRAADQAAYAAKRAGKGRVCRPEDAALSLDQDPAALAAQLEHANLATVEALAAAVDAKDPYTRGHSQRVSACAEAIARELGWAPGDVARVRLAGQMHDVGKIGIPDAILTKPAALSAEEYAVIKQHPAIGERMLADVPFLRAILPAVRSHHERWDGAGYPDGLVGEETPDDARILAVADAFDAMASSRTYRPGLPLYEARRRVREGSGTQFDPRVAAAFDRALAQGTLRGVLEQTTDAATGTLRELAG